MSFFNYIKPKCFSTQVNVLSTVLSTVLSIQKKELLLISSMRFTLSSYKAVSYTHLDAGGKLKIILYSQNH